MQERRQSREFALISRKLADQGSEQLEAEIKIIEGWLADLEETRDDNSESVAARKCYGDMLQSRQEFLKTLKEQAQQ